MKKHILPILLAITLASCYTPKFGVATAKITISKQGIHVQLMEKLRRLKDTTIFCQLVTRMR